MSATDTLKQEHKVILLVLDAAEREAQSIQSTGKVNAERVEKMLEFLGEFADRCHHAKEEELLFVRMEERGVPREGGPLGHMLAEHEEGRAKVRAIRQWLSKAANGDSEAVENIRTNLSAYVGLLRAHIDKEDNVLYQMADQVFSANDQRELEEAFERVEAEQMGVGAHEKYHQLAHELAET